jgi:hypothetical protein
VLAVLFDPALKDRAKFTPPLPVAEHTLPSVALPSWICDHVSMENPEASIWEEIADEDI